MLAESKQLRRSKHKSSRERSRSRDERRDTDCRSTSHHRRFHSRSQSDSLHCHIRHSDSTRCESSLAHGIHRKTIPAELKLITHDASYFLLKSNNFDNLLLAKAESVWSTPPQNEVRINTAFKVCKYDISFLSLINPVAAVAVAVVWSAMCCHSVIYRSVVLSLCYFNFISAPKSSCFTFVFTIVNVLNSDYCASLC